MAIAEQTIPATRTLHQDAKGMTGKITYRVAEADMFHLDLPIPGSPWPGPHSLPFLLCIEANWTQEECGMWVAEYDYSTDRMLGDEFCEISEDWASETVDVTRGYTWSGTGTPVDIDIPTEITLREMTMRFKAPTVPYEQIATAQYTVNDRRFRATPAGYMRFAGANISESYDITGEVISAQVEYKFIKRSMPWNQAWRPPLIARDANGNERYYQGADSEAPDFSVALDGQPIYVTAGGAHIGSWDTPMLGTAMRYGGCDYATVLNLPKLLGDG